MKTLITGGAGFIGSHLTEELIKKENEVIVYDNLFSGKLDNLKDVKDKIKFVKGDICDIETLKKNCKEAETIFHQAALKSVPASIKNPEQYNQVNITGTYNVLETARLTGVKNVVFASSSSVYGEKPELPQKIGKEDIRISPYAITKYAGEDYCNYFYKTYGLKTVSLRYFNVFGPRQDPKSQYAAVVPIFITKLLNNQKPQIYGTGEQSRDFTYVKDVVKANLLAVKKTGVFNIAGGKVLTINELAKTIAKMMNSEITPEYLPARKGDVLHSYADLSQTKKELGLDTTNFEEALKETINWFKKSI